MLLNKRKNNNFNQLPTTLALREMGVFSPVHLCGFTGAQFFHNKSSLIFIDIPENRCQFPRPPDTDTIGWRFF